MPKNVVDILENDFSPEILAQLLCDHTTDRNILWCTHDYESKGKGYQYADEIRPELITGEHGTIIRPRVLKSKVEQSDRVKDMAEVFTPSWVCNAQNNLVDEAWFGRKDVFNTENGNDHTWKANPDKIEFPDGKTWKDYVSSTRMEITCGEAPYLASRYDATTGDIIPVQNRIGLLDRKLRIVTENTESREEWINWTRVAYQNIYGYEWQGDNLLLARKALLYTFIEYYHATFIMAPPTKYLKEIADIISWNLWQMDGLKDVVPDSCHDVISKHKAAPQLDLFSTDVPQESEPKVIPCPGCAEDNIYKHNGKYCKIYDWEKKKTIRYIDLIKLKDLC